MVTPLFSFCNQIILFILFTYLLGRCEDRKRKVCKNAFAKCSSNVQTKNSYNPHPPFTIFMPCSFLWPSVSKSKRINLYLPDCTQFFPSFFPKVRKQRCQD